MQNDYTITDYINEECYNNYYKKHIDWNEYYETMAEKADIEYKDMEE